jgi:SAM-dependent methyltransferase
MFFKRPIRKVVQLSKRIIRRAVQLSMKGLRRGPHITRYYMYRHLSQFKVSGQGDAKVLSISHSVNLCKLLGFDEAQVVEANYPEYNILNLPFPENEFDYVVSDQVLEHVEGNPQNAVNETLRVLKPGGLAVLATCFIYPIHAHPGDYWRFTPDALVLLCKKFSKIIEVGGWGNPFIWFVVWLGLAFEGIPEHRSHPLHKLAMLNYPDCPVVTWVIAQK